MRADMRRRLEKTMADAMASLFVTTRATHMLNINSEPANVVDGMYAIAKALRGIENGLYAVAEALRPTPENEGVDEVGIDEEPSCTR